MSAQDLFLRVWDEFQVSYHVEKFYTERDIVWTIQKALIEKINRNGSRYKGYRVLNDFSIEQGNKIRVDLAIFEKAKVPEKKDRPKFIAEFKYQPDPARKDEFPENKFNPDPKVIFWDENGRGSVKEDIRRVRNYVNMNTRTSGISILIDEGNLFYNGPVFENDFIEQFGPEIFNDLHKRGYFCKHSQTKIRLKPLNKDKKVYLSGQYPENDKDILKLFRDAKKNENDLGLEPDDWEDWGEFFVLIYKTWE